jgi:hypothetical protein
MDIQTISIKEYLTRKGIPFREIGNELITHCLFNNCDEDSKGIEAHLYFNNSTSQYDCKKCGSQGNIFILAKHLGDSIQGISAYPQQYTQTPNNKNVFDISLVEKCHQALPENIKEYLLQRGISDTVVRAYKLGWGNFYGKWWITIPIKDYNGNYAFFKLRQDPNEGNEKITYPKGATAQIYDWGSINAYEILMICEGELDRLSLLSKGIHSISSTHGAMTFKDEWIESLKKYKKIYVCFDNDDAGKKGSDRLIKMLLEELRDTEIFKITLPNDVGIGGDITDYFTKLKGNSDDLFNKYAAQLSKPPESRILKVDKPAVALSFTEWQDIISQNFPDLLFPAEVGLSIICQLLINEISNPFALVYVDVPSAGKTIAINFFADIDGLTYASDKFTPASFVSNATNVKKEKLKEIDLLPKLKYKLFLIRDLATLFSKRDDDLNECLGLMTRVLDGEGLNTDSGVHGQRQYIGEYLFMLLAGSTPIPPRVWKMMGNLGSRLFFLNMNSKEKKEEELANQLGSLAYKEKEKICRIATKNFLLTMWNKHQNGIKWNKDEDTQETKIIIARCARLLAKLRGVVNVWKDHSEDGTEYSYNSPVIEQPDRINQLFYNLCRGHAIVCGRTKLNIDDLRLIIELAVDSAPTIRARLFRKLLDNNGSMSTSMVETALQCSKPTALKEMETLKILGLCAITQESRGMVGEPEKTITLLEDFQWFLSEECVNIRNNRTPEKVEVTPAINDFVTPLSENESNQLTIETVEKCPAMECVQQLRDAKDNYANFFPAQDAKSIPSEHLATYMNTIDSYHLRDETQPNAELYKKIYVIYQDELKTRGYI